MRDRKFNLAIRAGLLLTALAFGGATTASGGSTPTTAPAKASTTRPGVLRIAVYKDGGAPDRSADFIKTCLDKTPGVFDFKPVDGQAVRDGALDDCDVAVFPGGSGSGQAKSLDDAGRQKVIAFVKNGGGYVGICGGAYLATSNYTWSLHIVNANVVDREHWARGRAVLKLDMTPEGKSMLGAKSDEVDCLYHQGPLLGPGTEAGLPAYEPLATFATEVNDGKVKAPPGIMIGTTAIARAPYGQGHVVLISPHPEQTDGLDGFIRSSIRWANSGKDEPTDPGKPN